MLPEGAQGVTPVRPAPYSSTVRAKGWRFELDYEQIGQSDTWALGSKPGAADVRPFLLMLWYVSWQEVPCGSLPDDDEVIAAKIGLPDALIPELRRRILRGWWKADDGRLYHDTLVQRVNEMLSKRRSDADRQARSRAAKSVPESDASHVDVTRDSDRTPTGVGRESSTDHRPPMSSSPSSKKTTPRKPPKGGAAQFEEFWLAWPKGERKQDKAKCRDHWARHGLDAVAEAILADVRAKRGTEKWRDGFVEAPLTYLRGKRWEDGAGPTEQGANSTVEWHETRSGIEAKARELGVPVWNEAGWVRGDFPEFTVWAKRLRRQVEGPKVDPAVQAVLAGAVKGVPA